MDRLQRIYKLHQAISSRRHPVSCQTLQDDLECSRATVNRIIQEMRLYFNAPIEYDRQRNGYHYALADGKTFELPGLWFSETELYALLTTQQLLAHVQPGLLDTQLKPVKERIEQILAARHLGSEEISKRVRILRMTQCRTGMFSNRSGRTAAKKRPAHQLPRARQRRNQPARNLPATAHPLPGQLVSGRLLPYPQRPA
jgi:proteasome accessory factor C